MGEKILRRFQAKELLLSKSKTSYYPEPDGHNNKVKVELDLSKCATKKD